MTPFLVYFYILEVFAVILHPVTTSPIPADNPNTSTNEVTTLPTSTSLSSSLSPKIPGDNPLKIPSIDDIPSDYQEPHIEPVTITYPLLEHVDGGGMAFAESNIVFRPLFAYKRETAERRRVYYNEPSSNLRSSRGRYPDYYKDAPYDNVP